MTSAFDVWNDVGYPGYVPPKPDIDLNAKPASPAPSAGGSGTLTPEQIQARIDEALAIQSANQKAVRDKDASAFLKDLLSQYGMGELASSVDSLVQQWGNSTGVIANQLRQTDSYKTRFKGLLALQQKGVTDVTNEGDYIRLESEYRKAFRESGLQSYIGDAGSSQERDSIAKLVGDYSLSVNEVRNRISDAQRVVGSDTPAEVRDAAMRYYNIAPSDLVAYALRMDNSADRINQLANAALVGGMGARNGMQIGANAAEQVAGIYGNNDIDQGRLMTDLVAARELRDATGRLADIEQSTLSDDEALLSAQGLDALAKRKTEGLQSRERARFGGTSGVSSSSLSRGGSI